MQTGISLLVHYAMNWKKRNPRRCPFKQVIKLRSSRSFHKLMISLSTYHSLQPQLEKLVKVDSCSNSIQHEDITPKGQWTNIPLLNTYEKALG